MSVFKNFEKSQLSQIEQQKVVGKGVPVDNSATGGPGSASTVKVKKDN